MRGTYDCVYDIDEDFKFIVTNEENFHF